MLSGIIFIAGNIFAPQSSLPIETEVSTESGGTKLEE